MSETLKAEDPEAFKLAVDYEQRLQEASELIDRLDEVPFLHRSRVPLSEVEFDKDKHQEVFNFNNECEGMCGV